MNENTREEELRVAMQNMEHQLNTLYDEKRNLHMSIGVSDDVSIIKMVRSLEAQLNCCYEKMDSNVRNDRFDSLLS